MGLGLGETFPLIAGGIMVFRRDVEATLAVKGSLVLLSVFVAVVAKIFVLSDIFHKILRIYEGNKSQKVVD